MRADKFGCGGFLRPVTTPETGRRLRRDERMNKTLGIIAVATLAACLVGWLIFPKVKEKLFGVKYETRVEVLKAEIDDVPLDDAGTRHAKRAIVHLRLIFPYGEKPDSLYELTVVDEQGNPVHVGWPPAPTWDDRPGDRISVLDMEDVYFAADFRKGRLHYRDRDLAEIKLNLPPVRTKKQ